MFKKAIPVFARGEEASINYPLTLCATVNSLEDTVICLSAFSFYRLYVNGQFVCMGPARTAKGYARVDEIALGKYNKLGANTLEIQVAGYNCSSLSTARQTSFVVCELCRGDDVLLYTGKDFDAYLDYRRIREVERYSAQRHFGELWRVTDKDFRLFSERVELVPASNMPSYLKRGVPMPDHKMIRAEGYASRGEFVFDETLPFRLLQNSFYVSEAWGRFEEDEV